MSNKDDWNKREYNPEFGRVETPLGRTAIKITKVVLIGFGVCVALFYGVEGLVLYNQMTQLEVLECDMLVLRGNYTSTSECLTRYSDGGKYDSTFMRNEMPYLYLGLIAATMLGGFGVIKLILMQLKKMEKNRFR